MEINFGDILIQVLKSFWQFKELFLVAGGILALALVGRMLIDLMDRKSKIRWFLGKKRLKDLQELTPTQFENYIEELFRSFGYNTRTVGGRSDGGVDVEAEKDGVVHYIQCKKFITSKVPVGAVRDFYGAIADRVDGGKGYFITTNIFTLDAEKFAADKPIELVDKFKLMEYMKMVNIEMPEAKLAVCPKCDAELVRRNGKHGPFLGCSTYPKCDYTSSL